MDEGTATRSHPRRQRIIQRPRLTRLLDESEGRIKMLVAPAGYGKTTLAHDWLDGKSAAWYTGTRSSRDVAALAAGLHSAISSVTSTGTTLLERLTVTSIADDEADTLAVILGEDMVEWPREAWLVFDDYHTVGGFRPAESFVETLLMETSVNLLVLTRRRPTWASSRRIVYGEVFELGRAELAMTDEEARLVLGDAPDVSALVDLARGWPAVLGLAAKSGIAPPDLVGAPQLYHFFADEIYRRIDRRTRRALGELALYETEGRRLALAALEPDDRQRVQQAGLDSGFITTTNGERLEMHPLLRSFLEQRLRDAPADSVRALVTRAVMNLIAQRLWDEAFAIVDRFGNYDLIPSLIESSLQPLLRAGRLATLKTWMAKAPQDSCWVKLAAAELAFREGRFHESQTLASLAARSAGPNPEFCAEAWITAGRAAHAASHEEEALDAYRLARSITTVAARQKVAMYGELGAAIELELEDDALQLLELLNEFEPLEPHDRVMLSDKRVTLETHLGHNISIEQAREARQLLHFADPIARCSFRNVFGWALAAGGYCSEALGLTEEQLEDAERFRLGFVVPYALIVKALAHSGLHEYSAADELLTEADERAGAAGDETAQLTAWGVRTRAYNAQGAYDLVMSRPQPVMDERSRPVHFEIASSYAVAYAATGYVERARETADLVGRSSKGVEARVGAACARAICAIREGANEEALREAQVALGLAIRSGCAEPLVSAYRGSPEILMVLFADRDSHTDLERILAAFGDADLAAGVEAPDHSVLLLSRREKEVLSLVSRGLSNREVAERLFISPVTVKVHVRHIFEKLGVKSRSEAVMRAGQLSR